MRPNYYILDQAGQPVPEDDVVKWGQWYETTERHVAESVLYLENGKQLYISTVFLSLDHGYPWGDEGKLYRPILWETMVFHQSIPPQPPRWDSENNDWSDVYAQRYTSREEAVANHDQLDAYLRGHLAETPYPSEEEVRLWCDAFEAFSEVTHEK